MILALPQGLWRARIKASCGLLGSAAGVQG